MSVQAGKMHGAFALGLSLRTILLVILAAAFAVRLVLVFTYEINWDEFYYLALVYDFARGELTNTLQTLHVRFFGWLALVGVNEVNQVILARFLMWVLNVATTYFIFDIARRFTSENAALLGALCYATFSLVVQHGASFRADPIAAFFLMAALWLIMCKKHYAIAGLCAGLAGMITIKTAFYAPTIGAALCLAVLHAQDKRRAVQGGLMFAAIAGASFAALYFWHRTGITATPGEGSGALLAHSYSKTISSAGLFPRWGVFWRAAITNMVFWAAFGFGVCALLRKCLRGDWKLRTESLLLLGLAAPLASFLIYRNAFPYYYAFILPPAAVLCALGFDKFTARKPDGALHPLILISVIVIAATLSANTLKALGKGLSDQRRVLADEQQTEDEKRDQAAIAEAYPVELFVRFAEYVSPQIFV